MQDLQLLQSAFLSMKAALFGGCGLEYDELQNLENCLPSLGIDPILFNDADIDKVGLILASNVISGALPDLDIEHFFYEWGISSVENIPDFIKGVINDIGTYFEAHSKINGVVTGYYAQIQNTYFVKYAGNFDSLVLDYADFKAQVLDRKV